MRCFLLAGAVLPWLAPAPARAADTDEIVVSATRSPQLLADVPASVSLVTADQIARTPARTLDDVLRRLPSVDLPIAGTGEQHPTDTIVSMRGLSGIRALVLLDGVPINDPFFGYVQWSEVPLATVDRVEVVRGGGAPLWGNYAMGGVINIITRPVDETGFVGSLSGGGRGTFRADAHAALAGSGYGVGLDVGRNQTDGYVEQIPSARGAITRPTGFAADTVALTGNAALAPTLTLRARISRYTDDQHFLTALNTNRQRDWRATAALEWRPAPRDRVDLALFGDREYFRTDNPGTPDGAGVNDAEYIQNRHRTHARDEGGSLLWTRTGDGLVRSLTLGADVHRIHGRDEAQIFNQDGSPVRLDVGAGSQLFVGGFAQAELRPAAPLQLLLSLRVQDFRSFDGLDDTPGGLGPAVPGRRDRDVDPRVALRWQLPAGFALRVAGYRAFRAPTLDNLYRAASVPGYILYGNPTLRPETLWGGEAGVDYLGGPLRVQVTAYASRIDGFLTYRYLPADVLPAGFTVGARLINAGRARSRGVEAEASWALSPRLSLTAAYTHADAIVTRNPEDPASIGQQQPGVPRDRVSAGLDWTGPLGATVSPRLRWLARTNGDPDAIFRTDAHLVVDLAAAVPLARGLEAFVQVENLFGRRYVGTNDGFTAPLLGRPFTATGGVRVRLGRGGGAGATT